MIMEIAGPRSLARLVVVLPVPFRHATGFLDLRSLTLRGAGNLSFYFGLASIPQVFPRDPGTRVLSLTRDLINRVDPARRFVRWLC